MDMIVKLPPVKYQGRVIDSILVIVDRFIKVTIYLPVSETITAIELADLFFEKIVLTKGVPDSIVTDRGPIFTS